MLSHHERRTSRQFHGDLAASDPELAKGRASSDEGLLAARRAYLAWAITATASLTLLSLAVDWFSGALLFASAYLGAFACLLWWPLPRIGHRRTRRSSQ